MNFCLKHFNSGKLYFHHDPQEVYLAVEMLEICSPLYKYKIEIAYFQRKSEYNDCFTEGNCGLRCGENLRKHSIFSES